MLAEYKGRKGVMMVAAGEYKGKGSLEVYDVSSFSATPEKEGKRDDNGRRFYHNRQTASSSKLLAVGVQGSRIIFSDGNGGMKWVERDGVSVVRQFNVNDYIASSSVGSGYASGSGSGSGSGNSSSASSEAGDATPRRRVDGEDSTVPAEDDIVQKISPSLNPSLITPRHPDIPIGTEDLMIWTGGGRLGMVGFGGKGFKVEDVEEEVEEEREMELRRREREYGGEMRRALERQAMETRWLAGYGL